jgi:hypothetical protein
MRHLAAILLAMLILLAPSCTYFKNNKLFGKKEKTIAALRAQQDSIRVADSIRNVQKHLLDMENARLDSIRSAEEARVAFEKKNKYNIIVGSFITPEYAKNLADTYRQEGYNPTIIKMEGNNFELVSAESHGNFLKAVDRLRQFQDTVAFDTWMFIRQ